MTKVDKPAKPSERPLAAVVLAAGQSTRMKSQLPKVLHEVCGRPMVAYVLSACRAAGAKEMWIVVGFGRERVHEALADEPGVRFIEQLEQKGTGHAVSMCADALKAFSGDVLVLAGDMPMVRPETLTNLVGGHRASAAAASIVTTVLEDPTGYGRIVRDSNGNFERIVEHRDCGESQLAIREVNPSYYCFDCRTLFEALRKLRPDNAKGELYLTDALSAIRETGKPVRAATVVPAAEATGVNTRADLAAVNRMMQERIQAAWMEAGVTIEDPANTWIDGRARIGPDTVIRPFTFIEGAARIGSACRIGPFALVGDAAAVADGAVVGPGVLSAFDATAPRPARLETALKRRVQVMRRPPAQSGCP